MKPDLIKFKHVLEYFVAHQNYMQSNNSSVKGYEEYIKPFIDKHSFSSTGQGWNDDSIQKQIADWEDIATHRLCINIQPNFGDYKSKKCYLNWIHTGINIFCEWQNEEVVSLSIGYAYWWKKPTRYKIELTNTTSDLGLFDSNHDETILGDFYNRFVKEIDDFDNHKGDYYNKCAEYENRIKQQKIMNEIRPYTEILKSNFNIILTGAPGTGKTYLAKQIAQQMIFGEIKEKMSDDEEKQFNEQCGFVQFHPCYDYTDLVEGLRPIQEDNGTVGFERKDGIFKSFCKKALSYTKTNVIDNFEDSWSKLVEYLETKDYIDIPFIRNNKKTFRVELNEYGTGLANRMYQDDNFQKGEWVKGQSKFFSKDQLHRVYKGLSGVPSGGHDSYRKAIINKMKKDFGLKAYNAGSEIVNGKKEFVFIIDEINRGEISKIFGELFFSIDPGYRGVKGKVKTQYQNLIEEGDEFYDGFYVPDNVYIIGTMNDIDRSVESMDFAFRRRFAFKEVTAEESQGMFDAESAWGNDNDGKSLKPDEKTIEAIKGRMNSLNKLIWHEPKKDENDDSKSLDGLSAAYHIGASYFLKLINYKKDDGTYNYKKLWDYHLEGLLREYLRGMHDIESSMNRLKDAYDYNKDGNNN